MQVASKIISVAVLSAAIAAAGAGVAAADTANTPDTNGKLVRQVNSQAAPQGGQQTPVSGMPGQQSPLSGLSGQQTPLSGLSGQQVPQTTGNLNGKLPAQKPQQPQAGLLPGLPIAASGLGI
ncbi:MAG TPA: hypothetical protein VGO89_02925 [Streptomyces sp.]|jgi:hypothetical protein|nr:hypothetical protein [Streptomyces sp.]